MVPVAARTCPKEEDLMIHRHEEWHLTVKGNPLLWHAFCLEMGVKPLWIELNNFERQLMCAITDPVKAAAVKRRIEQNGVFKLLREKYEVMPNGSEENPLYYECHVKLDGPFIPTYRMSSRDLYRDERWYLTERWNSPFNPLRFIEQVRASLEGICKVVGSEYEVALIDTNPDLDVNWAPSSTLQRAYFGRLHL
jgi:hypothetical protein